MAGRSRPPTQGRLHELRDRLVVEERRLVVPCRQCHANVILFERRRVDEDLELVLEWKSLRINHELHEREVRVAATWSTDLGVGHRTDEPHALERCSALHLESPNPILALIKPDTYTDSTFESVKFALAPGEMLLFPSWIKHGSGFEPNESEHRIVISINAR